MIASRSPYYVGDNNTTLVVEIYTWAIGTVQPATPNYTIRKLSYDQSVAEYLTINASPFLVEKLSMAAPFPSQYPTPYGAFAIQNVKIVINDSIPIVIADPTNLVLTEEVLIPKDPTFLQMVSKSKNTIDVRWVKSTTGPMVSYRAYVYGILNIEFTGDVNTGQLVGLQADTNYNITVRAWDGVTESGDSNILSVRTVGNLTSVAMSGAGAISKTEACQDYVIMQRYTSGTTNPVPNVDRIYTNSLGTVTFDGEYQWWKFGNDYSVLVNNDGLILQAYIC